MRRDHQPDPTPPEPALAPEPVIPEGPHVAAVRGQLSRIRSDWLDQDAIDGVLEQAAEADRAQALRDAVAARGGQLAAAVATGDPDAILSAAAADLAVERATGALGEPLAPDLTDSDLDRIAPRLAAAAQPLRVDVPEPAVARELRAFNYASAGGRRPRTGPAVTDTERGLLLDRDGLTGDLAAHAQQLVTWQTTDYPTRLARLGALTSLHAGRTALDERARVLAERTAEVDIFRRDNGLTWDPEAAARPLPIHA